MMPIYNESFQTIEPTFHVRAKFVGLFFHLLLEKQETFLQFRWPAFNSSMATAFRSTWSTSAMVWMKQAASDLGCDCCGGLILDGYCAAAMDESVETCAQAAAAATKSPSPVTFEDS